MNDFTTEQLTTITNIALSVAQKTSAQSSDTAIIASISNPWAAIAIIGIGFATAWIITTFIKNA